MFLLVFEKFIINLLRFYFRLTTIQFKTTLVTDMFTLYFLSKYNNEFVLVKCIFHLRLTAIESKKTREK